MDQPNALIFLSNVEDYPLSYCGHSHDYFLIGTVQVVGPQLAEDVQNGITTVVVENSPHMMACPLSAVHDTLRAPLGTAFTADGVI